MEAIILSQRFRLYIFALYVLISWFIGFLLTGKWYINPNPNGLWFYSILSYLVLHLITAPFFKTPKDIIANSITCLAFIFSFNLNEIISSFKPYIVTLRWIALLYCSLLFISAIIAILSANSSSNFFKITGKITSKICDYFGSGKIEFTFIVFLSIFGFHLQNTLNLLYFTFFWLILITIEPLENLARLVINISDLKGSLRASKRIGTIKAYENPCLALITLDSNAKADTQDTFWIIRDDKLNACFPLCYAHLSDESWCRIFISDVQTDNISVGVNGEVIKIPEEKLPENLKTQIETDRIFKKRNNILGFVAEGSCLNHIYFDIVNYCEQLYEGRLIEVPIGDKIVIYQVTDATLRFENLEQKNSQGFTRGRARKIGLWNPEKDKFDIVDWMPSIYAPVYFSDSATTATDPNYIGYVPGSNYRIKWNSHLGVTHNTAILGILGIGKSYLAYELIARMVKDNIKVICLDITGEYENYLSTLLNNENSSSKTRINNAIIGSRNSIVTGRRSEGGNQNNFKDSVKKESEFFLNDNNPEKLRIYNPESFDVTKQVWTGQRDQDSTVPLTLVEVTKIIAEVLLSVVKHKGFSREFAKVCLVLEEAHSLIPERGSFSEKDDEYASIATAKAIMQGRKYGMGCLVITQRTANVLKSVLNQCNTIFAMRVFDATGMEFLRNYIGEEYTDVLTGLKDRHAVIFGRASSSNQPIIIRLNDRDNFVQEFNVPDMKTITVPNFNEVSR